jgi:hypothetical protein
LTRSKEGVGMRGLIRTLVGIAGFGALLLLPIQAAAVGGSFTAIVGPDCVQPGGTLSIRIPTLAAGSVVSVRLTSSTASGGSTVFLTGTLSANGTFTGTIKVPADATAASAQVAILVTGNGETEIGFGNIRVAGAADACPSPGTIGIAGDNTFPAAPYSLSKTCASGVSGSAVFALTMGAGEGGTFALPDVTAPCNGGAVALPELPAEFGLTLHEKTVPIGGKAAADLSLTIPPASNPIVIHNDAAVTATPTPTAQPTPAPTTSTLAFTGGGQPSGPPLWPLVVGLAGLLTALGGAYLRHRQQS